MEREAFLRIDSLKKGYGEGEAHVEVLRGISTAINRGEVCVLLGPSGSGKSTFLNLVGGLEPADSGSIWVGDTELTKLSDRNLVEYRRRELGFVFQFYNHVGELTVQENIEVCEYLSENPLPKDELLKSLGLWEHRKKFPHQISGGQQQRCAIGRRYGSRAESRRADTCRSGSYLESRRSNEKRPRAHAKHERPDAQGSRTRPKYERANTCGYRTAKRNRRGHAGRYRPGARHG